MTTFVPPRVGIRALRDAHGLTLEELAERIRTEGVDVHIGTLSNIETGRKTASRKLLAAWARALGLHQLDVTPSEPRESAEAVA